MNKSIRKSCILKIADMAPQSDGDFTTTVRKAVETLSKAADRRLVLEEEPRRYRLLNDFFVPAGSIRSTRGSVFAFTENQDLNGVVLRPDVASYPITTFSPPQHGTDRMEFIEGLTWFAAFKNYIAIFTDKAVFPSTLERYFSWLLSKAAGIESGKDESIAVLFRDPPKPDLSEYDMTGVSSLFFKESMQSDVEIPSSSNTRRRSAILKPKGKAYEMLKTFLKSFGASPPSFMNVQTPEELEDLRVEVRISCLRPKKGGVALAELKRTAEKIRDAGAGNVSFKFSDGRVLDAEDLAVASQMTISAVNGLPNTMEAVRKLDAWMMQQIERLTIPTA